LPWNVIGPGDATDGWTLVTGPDPRLRKEWDYDAERGTGHYAVVFAPTRTGPCRVVVVRGDGRPARHRDSVSVQEGKALAQHWIATDADEPPPESTSRPGPYSGSR